MTFQHLLDDLDEVIARSGSSDEAVKGTCQVLKRYSAEHVELPSRLRECSPGCYARHLVHHHQPNGYCVVAMVWSPGQGTSIHDHDGTWCVEGCMEGNLDVTSFRFEERVAADQIRLSQESVVSIGCGQVGALIPPFEHHKIHNAYQQPAITLHVYGKELAQCTRYEEEENNLFRVKTVPLSYTTVPD
jgi:predicted metal-dependent enzyme (double-stranded beta helix superfamily)